MRISVEGMKKNKEKYSRTLSGNYVLWATAICFIVAHATGYCEDSIDTIDALTNNTINTIFSPWIRKAALGFGGGFGLFQSYMGGSIRPLLTWGGLGLAVNYVPKLIDVIAKVGA